MDPSLEGAEFELDDPDTWSQLMIEPGMVLEVNLMSTDLFILAETWAAFLVRKVELQVDGSVIITAQTLGCEEDEAATAVAARFQGREPLLHLCASRPCVELGPHPGTAPLLHVTCLRWWTVRNFQAGYLSRAVLNKLPQMAKEIQGGDKPVPRRRKKDADADAGDGAGPPPRITKAREKAKPKEKAKEKEAPKKKKAKETKEKEITELQREKLRARLAEVKRKHTGEGGPAPPVESVLSGSGETGSDGEEEESFSYAPTEALDTGTVLREVRRGKDYKVPAAKEDKLVPYEGTKDKDMRNLSGQLVKKALAVSRARVKDKEKKRKAKGGGEGAVAALRKILLGNTEGTQKDKDKDKKKKKKKKKRKRLENGAIVSCSTSSSGSSEAKEEAETSEESDLEAPMKKRSKNKPGSVLSLLTEHIRMQMEQDALTEVPKEGRQVTSGVKVVSYFNQHVKPSFLSHQKELREMYTLGSALDLLRAGDLPRLGDALSARFIAIHQALIDQNWQTARHMELFPLEDSSAASASLVLASRKHQKLVERVQGKGSNPGWSTWTPKGRPKGRGDWYDQGEGQTKGKKGKGDRKGKGKGKQWNQGGGDKAANEWAKTQDKGEAAK